MLKEYTDIEALQKDLFPNDNEIMRERLITDKEYDAILNIRKLNMLLR